MKKLLIIILPIIFLLFAGIIKAQDKEIVLYYSTTCSYCQMVLDDIEEYKIEESLNFTKVEINSLETATQFDNAAKACELSDNETGYPMLYVDGECFVGANLVTDELLSQAGIEVATTEDEYEQPKDDSTPITTPDTENTTVDTEKEDEKENTEVTVQYPKFSALTIIAMIIGPIAFIAFAYLMIKKLNL